MATSPKNVTNTLRALADAIDEGKLIEDNISIDPNWRKDGTWGANIRVRWEGNQPDPARYEDED